jgi:hypothetical protein
VKKLALAVLLAAATTAAPAAVTIRFTGQTFDTSGVATQTESSYDIEPGIADVVGRIVIDTNAILGANQATDPAVHYNGGAFLSGSFTSNGGLTPTILNVPDGPDDLIDVDVDFGTTLVSFSREIDLGAFGHQNSLISIYSNSALPTRYYQGVLLPDFKQADLNDLYFTVTDRTGTDSLYVAREFSGTVTGLIFSVPEPASWAMMVGGFGLVGGAMRRRRDSAVAA